MVSKLRIRCDGSHRHVQLAGKVEGIARCRFAQAWSRKLCELIISGVVVTLGKVAHFPVRVAVTDPYMDKACRGCTAHAARHDPRHSRVVGICKFPHDEDQIWGCPACVKFLPSTHSNHIFDDSCQWTSSATRQSSVRQLAPRLRDSPIPPGVAPAMSSADVVLVPPKVGDKDWYPVWHLPTLATLDQCQTRDGWHEISNVSTAVTWTNGRMLRDSEPRYPRTTFNSRSVYGYFPESPHKHGTWWQLEDREPITSVQLSFAVPTLVLVFRRSVSKEKESSILNDMLGHKTAEVAANNEKKVRQLYREEKRETKRKHPLFDTTDELRQVINSLKRVKDQQELMADQRHLLKAAGVPKKKVDATGPQRGKKDMESATLRLGILLEENADTPIEQPKKTSAQPI